MIRGSDMMNIDTLNAYIVVTELKSISLAAKQLHISQSALSQQIQSLERELDIKLFDRSHRGVVLTVLGNRVYEYARQVVQSTQQLENDLIHLKNQVKTIKIVSTFVFHSYALPCSLHYLNKTYPNYQLDIKANSSNEIERQIANGIGDIGLISGKPTIPTINYKKIYQDQYCLVASKDFEVPDELTLADLCNYPMILLDENQKSRQLLNNELEKHGLNLDQLNVPYLLDSVESIKVTALQGYGLVFLPYMSIKKELYLNQLKIIELTDFDYMITYYAIKKTEFHPYDQDTNVLICSIEEILGNTIC